MVGGPLGYRDEQWDLSQEIHVHGTVGPCLFFTSPAYSTLVRISTADLQTDQVAMGRVKILSQSGVQGSFVSVLGHVNKTCPVLVYVDLDTRCSNPS